MSYAVKYKTNKGEEEMKKRRVAKLIALSMVAATLLTGVNVQAKEEKVVTAMTSIDLTLNFVILQKWSGLSSL